MSDLTMPDLKKEFAALLKKWNDPKYEARVADRKKVNQLYTSYSTLSSDDNTLLKDLKEIESLMGKVNEKMNV